jgi:DNA-binding NtrC family response regulator
LTARSREAAFLHCATVVSEAQLVANRFIVNGAGAVDLATGRGVRLLVTAAGDDAQQTRWAVRCEASRQLLRPSGSRLVDYGAIGRGHRFEAWSLDRRAAGSGAGDGSPAGVVMVRRRLVPAIAELFEPGTRVRPSVVAVVGAAGAGKTIAIGELARAARLQGMVPLSVDALAWLPARLRRAHTLLVIADEARVSPWRAFVALAIQAPGPHVLLISSEEEVAGAHCAPLERVPAGALVESVRPVRLPERTVRRVRRAAARADGLPGRFVRSLWPEARAPEAHAAAATRRRVAEQPAPYGASASADAPVPVHEGTVGSCPWPATDELDVLRRRLDSGIRDVAAGRIASGERALRQAIGALARRSDWEHAGEGAVKLGGALLARGRAGDALAILETAGDYGRRTGRDTRLIGRAALSGHAWIDLARLDQAEAVLAAARTAAAASGDPGAAAEAALGMARCLFWRGRYAEADAAIADLSDRRLSETMRVRIALARSRHAVGLRDFGRAITAATEADGRARELSDSDLAAAAACAAALAHLSVSDLDAVARDAARALAAARVARSPMRAIRARLLLAEAERRRDRRTAAGVLVRRLARLRPGSLPPIVGARAALLRLLLEAKGPVGPLVARHASATGLPALVLLAPDGATGGAESGIGAADVDRFVQLLAVCQTASDEAAVLTDVCAMLRRELRAAAVAFVGRDGSAPPVASDGARIERAVAERAMAARALVCPHRLDDRVEAAAPVSYGGDTIGAIIARWPLATSHDLSRAGASLTVAATAAAPALAALLARHAAQVMEEPGQVLGVSHTAADLRRAISRAAASPFPVLIEGESGSGKELVARALHRGSPRRVRAFCALNCAALPDDLVESELFGHARGAFTGAIGERPGVFEEANGGTLFLDEVGELSPRAQAKVLRVIQEGELRRVGENVGRRVDLRVVSATNRDLRAEVDAGRFRLDLLYRLDVIRITVAPLRERREDIAVLAEHIWADAARRIGSQATLAPATVAALARYDWPGNVRELQNVLAALAVRASKRGVVPPTALPAQFGMVRPSRAWRLGEARRTFEEGFVRAALARSGGRRTQAAAELGVTRQGLTKLMSRLGIAP